MENQSDWYLGNLWKNHRPWPALGRGFNTGGTVVREAESGGLGPQGSGQAQNARKPSQKSSASAVDWIVGDENLPSFCVCTKWL